VVFKKVSSTNFLNEIVENGDYLTDMLKGINQQTNFFSEIRGKGLMIGAEIREEHGQIAAKIMQTCLSEGLLILQSGPSVIRLLPAFTIRKTEISRAMEILRKVILQHS
jgi:acetylornithine/N-succinyldiaminopimelate aminotransferase